MSFARGWRLHFLFPKVLDLFQRPAPGFRNQLPDKPGSRKTHGRVDPISKAVMKQSG